MTHLRRIALVPALLLVAAGAAHGAPRVRDAWHAYAVDGKRYGSVHTVVTRLPDGNYSITTQSRLLLNALGLNKEEITERGEYIVTPDYGPVSIAVEGKTASGTIRVTGRRRGDGFELTSAIAGIERSHLFENARAIIPRACLDDWLADRPPGFESGEVTLLDEAECLPNQATVKRIGPGPGGSGSVWSIDAGPLNGDQRLVLDALGTRAEFSVASGIEMKMTRCSADLGRDIDYRRIDGREAMMFPLAADLGRLDRLESLTVELRWQDIDFDLLHLEDDRQHVVERAHKGGYFRAIVRIEPPRPLTAPLQLPVTGAEFARYLGESRFIKPRDPKIVALAADLTRGAANALEAAKAISTWVSKNVEIAYIAETLAGPEVLACRKGKCSEFATLFASLARSAGIPTRLVLGERIIPDQWGGHMWNEVYVGRWIPVDAGYDEVGKSAALLKLLDHDSVEGLMPLRRVLPRSLQIEILKHESTAMAVASRFKTGIAGRVYTSAEFDCRMTAPGKEWLVEQIPEPGAPVIRFKLRGNDDLKIHFVPFPLPAPAAPKMILGLRQMHYKSNLKGFKPVDGEACMVNGLAGHRVEFRHTPEKGETRRCVEVVWRKGPSGYLLALDAADSAYDQIKPSFATLLASFEDLEGK